MKPLTTEALTRFWDHLDSLKVRRIPQMCVTGIAGFSMLAGWLFLALDERFSAVAVQHLVTTIPTLVWGMVFLGAGFFLAALAWVDFTKAVYPCLAFALVMFAFTAASAFDFFDGPATGLISILAGAVGWFSVTTSLLCTAPRAATIMHEESQ